MEEEEGSLTADMVERLARSVASEPLPIEAKKTEGARPAAPAAPAASSVPPPAYTREPLRLNMPASAPAPSAPQAPQQPQASARPAPQAPPAASSVPPPAYTREPLRLNMPASQAPAPSAAQPPTAQAPAAQPPAGRPAGTPSPPTPAAYPSVTPSAQRKPTTLPGFPSTPAPGIPKEPQFLVFSNPAPAVPPARRTPTQPDFPMPMLAAPSAAAPAPAPTTAPASTAAPAPGAPPASASASPSGAAPIPITELVSGAPQAQPPKPAAPAASQDVPDWTLAQARAALKDATRDRDRLIDVALRFGRRTFDYVAAFAILRGTAGGWEARGDGMTGDQLSQVSVPLDASSVFRTIAVTRGSYAGPLPPDALSKHYVELFGRQSPRTVFLYPVEVRGRLVALLYGDCGQKPISQRRLSDFILFCQDLPSAFQELILFRKQRMTELRAPDIADAIGQPGSTAPAPAPAVAAGLGWSPFFGRASGTLGRAAALPPRVMSEERPPPDFSPLVKRLTGPDAAQRAGAMAELARTPEASARVLAASFPGPTAWSRLPVVELPEADELGPIPAALSRLGRPAAQALAPLLDSADPDTRYFALLTAGNLPYVELVDGVLRGLFDLEPDISSAARVAASALKHLPRFDAAMWNLRQELTNRDPLRRSLAARALGTLHDRESIEGLINLTGSDDEMCAEAAAEALREITRATFGRQPRQWTAWWAENRTRRRADWLVAALRHKELDVRLVAIEELGRALNDTLGYYADAPEADREAAVRRWEAAAVDPARARRLGAL